MRLAVISTGSGGNAYCLQTGAPPAPSLLLEAGVSPQKIVRALGGLRGVNGCLITHEHGDHASGACGLCALYGMKIYCTNGTASAIGARARAVEMLKPFDVAPFTVLAFPTQHDAAEPCGFLIRYNATGETVLYATDTYYLKNTFPGIHYWIVECNFIEDIAEGMAESGEIDKLLLNRLRSSHMSLRRLKDTLLANDLHDARKIVLVHLSDGRSDEQRMVREISQATGVETVAADNGMIIDLELTPF